MFERKIIYFLTHQFKHVLVLKFINLVEVHLVMLHTKYQGFRPHGFRQEDFFTFSLYKPIHVDVKHVN